MKKIFLLLTMCVLLFTHSNGQYAWTQVASMNLGRYCASGFTIGAYSYLGTGYTSSASALNDWWQYDPVNNSWTQKANVPGVRSSASSFVINGKGYVGLGLAGTTYLTDLREYDPVSNTWTQKASLPSTGRFGTACFSIGSTGYICCGNFGSASGQYTNEVFGYDAVTNSWSAKATFPGMVRYGGRGDAIGNYGYVLGGINGTGSGNSSFFSDLYQYDPITNSWTQKSGIPAAGRNYATTFVLDGNFVVGNGVSQAGYFSDFYAYDPTNNGWSSLPSMPANETRWAAVGFSNSSAGYVATGNSSLNNPIVVKSNVWKLSLSTGINDVNQNNQIEFNLYPTMASDYININFTSINDVKFTMMITNAEGKILKNQLLDIGSSVVNTENFAQGLYFANVLNSENKIVKSVKFFISKN